MKGVWYLGCTRHSVSPFLGPGGPCTLDLFSGTSLGQLGVGKMPCTTSRRLGRSRAGLPGRRARALALVPQRILCCCPWFYVCLGSPSIKSLHVSEFASFMNLVVPCLIKQLRNIRHAHAADVHVAHVLLCVHIWCRRTLIDCPQTVCTETPKSATRTQRAGGFHL